MVFIQSREKTRDHSNYPNLRINDNEYPNDKQSIKTPLSQVNFRRAAAAGDLGTVQRLIDEEKVDINCAGRNGATALHKV